MNRHQYRHLVLFPVLLAILLVFVLACSHNRQFEPILNAQVAIRQAEDQKADVHAAKEIAEAQIVLQKADKAHYNFEYDKAAIMANDAESLAQLAILKNDFENSKVEVAQAEEELQFITEAVQAWDEQYIYSQKNLIQEVKAPEKEDGMAANTNSNEGSSNDSLQNPAIP